VILASASDFFYDILSPQIVDKDASEAKIKAAQELKTVIFILVTRVDNGSVASFD
jgi:hypothetical protein